jgi:hypothetical protein
MSTINHALVLLLAEITPVGFASAFFLAGAALNGFMFRNGGGRGR